MLRYFAVLMSFGLLSSSLLAEGAVVCSETETLLRMLPRTVTQQMECLKECTGMTYYHKLQLQDDSNIRFTESTEEVLGEYCWPTALTCNIGESFQSAFVVLPVDISTVGYEMLQVRATTLAATTLSAHRSPSTISESCGLRYEVTQHFGTEQETSFCIQVVIQEDVLGDRALKCPPYLVTFWQRNPNQSNQQGDG